MGQERLSDLSIMSIETKNLEKLKSCSAMLINMFEEKKARRVSTCNVTILDPRISRINVFKFYNTYPLIVLYQVGHVLPPVRLPNPIKKLIKSTKL
jgi:hypothetical protein